MRYDILGPIRLINGDRSAHINAKKIGTLLILLLSNADRVVSTDHIISEIWGDRIPLRAVAGVHVYISQLRKTLGHLAGSAVHIHTRPSGYQLELGNDEVDALAFLCQAEQGRNNLREKNYELVTRILGSALSSWYGPLDWGTDCGPNVEAFAAYLMETRLEASEMLIDAQLQLGCHRELVGRLRSLVAQNPLREGFYRQLMLALYRSDRRADALGVYQSARRTLLNELGLEPCRSLQQVHHEILVDEANESILNGYEVKSPAFSVNSELCFC
jgi:DNA-binding SARP family transcriptional activator